MISRKRNIIVIRTASLDGDLNIPLAVSIYVGHPPNLDASGWGMAKDVIDQMKKIGINDGMLMNGLRGMTYDGAYMHCNVSYECLLIGVGQ